MTPTVTIVLSFVTFIMTMHTSLVLCKESIGSKVTLGREVLFYLHFATLGSKRSKTARNHLYKNSVRNVVPNQRFLFNPIGDEMFSSCSSAKHIKGTKNWKWRVHKLMFRNRFQEENTHCLHSSKVFLHIKREWSLKSTFRIQNPLRLPLPHPVLPEK